MKTIFTLISALLIAASLCAETVFVKATGQIIRGSNPDAFSDTELYHWAPAFSPDKATILSIAPLFRKLDNGTVREMTTVEKDALDIDATGLRQAKIDAIFAKTALLEQSLTFTWETKEFKLGPHYQDHWANLYMFSKDGLIVYPKKVSTTNGTAHELHDHADVTSFVTTALRAAETFYSSDDQYFIDIDNAADWSGLEAVVDDR